MMKGGMAGLMKQAQQMQEQMAKQAGALFPGMPGFKPPKR